MTLKRLLAKLLPENGFLMLRKKYFIFRMKINKPMSEEIFRSVLVDTLEVKKGDTLLVHSSLKFLNVNFSKSKILQILLELVGENGTLIFPAWHFNGRAEDYLKAGLIFDVAHSKSVLGGLSEMARTHPEAVRSIHPTNSIVAVGKNAKEICSGHETSIYPCGKSSPFYKMLKYDAKIVGIGVNSSFLSIAHCVEDVMGNDFPLQARTDETYFGKVKLPDGEIIEVETLAAHKNIQKRNVPGFIKKYIPKQILSDYHLHGSDFFVADANALFNKITELAKQNKTIYNT